MTSTSRSTDLEIGSADRWHDLADRVLAGSRLERSEGLAILESDDGRLLDVLSAAYRVRSRWFGNKVHLNFLINAKSGLCGEDCGYCSQSRISTADIPKHNFLNPDQILDGARLAAEHQAGTYCIVISGRAPDDQEVEQVTEIVARIKEAYPLKICVCLGLLTYDQAVRIRACGVDRVNHNLNTSERFYPSTCTTHTYQDRLETLRAVRAAGLEICSGGIVGMGEEDEDVVDLALALSQFNVESLPVNFLIPIPGTPMETRGQLNPRYCLKVLALFRMANPRSELRIAAGREVHLGALQPLALYPANSLFVGDYLTTNGQPPVEDHRMIEAMGFEAVIEGADRTRIHTD
jgi:biotin synthase